MQEKGSLAGSKDVGRFSTLLTAQPATPAKEGEVGRRGETLSCPTPGLPGAPSTPRGGGEGQGGGEWRQVALTIQAAGDQLYCGNPPPS